MVKRAIEDVPPFEFLAIRFAIATVALALVFPRQLVRAKGSLKAGLIAGIALAAGYGFQTTGLEFTSATNAGFVTGLFVVFAPPLASITLRRLPSRTEWLSVLLAFIGLCLLTLGPGFAISVGDVLVLGCAFSFAIHIVLLARYSPEHDARPLTMVQIAVSSALFLVISAAFENPAPVASRAVISALLVTAIGASAVAFLVQTWAQSHLDPTQTAVTLTMEPVFAGLAGFILLGEGLSVQGWMGAGLILVSTLWVSLRSRG
jgi:drug/metabolite transporter (DMT)-like permease